MFWVLIYFTNFVVLFRPAIITPRYTRFNRPTEAFLESLNPKYRRIIQLEALAVILMHTAMIYFWKIPIVHYLAVMFGFGFVWSAMQYAHHYGTVREVQKGADRKSTRLNSSHLVISYAVFCLKKKKKDCLDTVLRYM